MSLFNQGHTGTLIAPPEGHTNSTNSSYFILETKDGSTSECPVVKNFDTAFASSQTKGAVVTWAEDTRKSMCVSGEIPNDAPEYVKNAPDYVKKQLHSSAVIFVENGCEFSVDMGNATAWAYSDSDFGRATGQSLPGKSCADDGKCTASCVYLSGPGIICTDRAHCNDHGECNNGTCDCDCGFKGDTCEVKLEGNCTFDLTNHIDKPELLYITGVKVDNCQADERKKCAGYSTPYYWTCPNLLHAWEESPVCGCKTWDKEHDPCSTVDKEDVADCKKCLSSGNIYEVHGPDYDNYCNPNPRTCPQEENDCPNGRGSDHFLSTSEWKDRCLESNGCHWGVHAQTTWTADGQKRLTGCYSEYKNCFPGDALVCSASRGPVRMAELVVGDVVQTGVDRWEPVVGFYDYNPQCVREFLVMRAGARTVCLTSSHLLRTVDGFTQAKHATVGTRVWDVDGTVLVVSAAARAETRVGVFSPATRSGIIVVDGVQCSTYAKPTAFASVPLGDATVHATIHVFATLLRWWWALTLPLASVRVVTPDTVASYHSSTRAAKWLFSPIAMVLVWCAPLYATRPSRA